MWCRRFFLVMKKLESALGEQEKKPKYKLLKKRSKIWKVSIYSLHLDNCRLDLFTSYKAWTGYLEVMLHLLFIWHSFGGFIQIIRGNPWTIFYSLSTSSAIFCFILGMFSFLNKQCFASHGKATCLVVIPKCCFARQTHVLKQGNLTPGVLNWHYVFYLNLQ
jgi:hypothetical protein